MSSSFRFHDRYKAVEFVFILVFIFIFVLRYRLRPLSPIRPVVWVAHTLHHEEYVLCSCLSSVVLTKSQKTLLNYGLFFDVLTVRCKPGISDGERIHV